MLQVTCYMLQEQVTCYMYYRSKVARYLTRRWPKARRIFGALVFFPKQGSALARPWGVLTYVLIELPLYFRFSRRHPLA